MLSFSFLFFYIYIYTSQQTDHLIKTLFTLNLFMYFNRVGIPAGSFDTEINVLNQVVHTKWLPHLHLPFSFSYKKLCLYWKI